MSDLVSYEVVDGVAVITMDDGKANAVSSALQAGVNNALDRAEADGLAVVLTGRPGFFSAGFDLKTLAKLKQFKSSGSNPDSIEYDPETKRVYAANHGETGDVTMRSLKFLLAMLAMS